MEAKNTLNVGLNPQQLSAGMVVAVYHVEAGARSFVDFSKKMVETIGEEFKPYFASFYLAASRHPELDTKGMNTQEEVDSIIAKELAEKSEISSPLKEKEETVSSYVGTDDNVYTVTKNLIDGMYYVNHPNGVSSFDDITKARAEINSRKKKPEKEKASKEWPDRAIEFANFFYNEHTSDGWGYSSITAARKAVAENFGISKAQQDTNDFRRTVDEAIETAVVKLSREIYTEGLKGEQSSRQMFDRMVDLYDQQPKLSNRSTESTQLMQYSTPAPLAFLANILSWMEQRRGDVVYEPTAGTGMLLMGADVDSVYANELSATRSAILKSQGIKTTQSNAIDNSPPQDVDVVIANPPFGKVKGEDKKNKLFTVNGFKTLEVDQAIALKALSSMTNGGRATLIVGGLFETEDGEVRASDYNKRKYRKFYKELYDNYQVTDHFTVAGSLYGKQGANWPVDIITISGKGKSDKATPNFVAPTVYKTFDELGERLEAIENQEENRFGVDATREQQDAATPKRGPRSKAGRPAMGPGNVGTGKPAGETVKTAESGAGDAGRGAVRPSEQTIKPGTVAAGSDSGTDGLGMVRTGGEQSGTSNVATDRSDGKISDGDTRGKENSGKNDSDRVDRSTGTEGSRPRVVASKGQTQYKPSSGSGQIGTLTPVNMSDPLKNALNKLNEQHESIDKYVMEKVGFKDIKALYKALSAEQIDATALSISSMENGTGFILGDQTGIGKGRVVAATIKYALNQGKTPVFFTEKQGLYADMYRDMVDVGFDPSVIDDIMQTNAVPVTLNKKDKVKLTSPTGWANTLEELGGGMPDRGKANNKKKTKIVFTTYDQINTQFKEKGTDIMHPRRKFLENLVKSDNVVLIMDEAHNAGGSGDLYDLKPDKNTQITPYPRALFLRNLIKNVDSVLYSSATYAKNPEVMDLYAATDLSLGVGGDMQSLADAVNKGGIPYQQITASMLTKAGQYIRRERSFEGVKYTPKVMKVDTNNAETVSAALSSIRIFEESHMNDYFHSDADAQVSASVGEGGAKNHTGFTSLMHNIVDQMLLSLKVQPSIDEAISILEKSKAEGTNEQVVLTVSNTMETFLNDYASANNIIKGQEIDVSFNDLLKRYLWTTRRYTVKDDQDSFGNPVQYWASDEDIGAQAAAEYNKTMEIIDSLDLASMPVSPIDYMHKRLAEAGFPALEITGRSSIIDYSDGFPKLSARNPRDLKTDGKLDTIEKFNNGSARAIILNISGSTGISLHASERNPIKGQGKRTMIIAQAEKDINTHMQMLGRVHRTGQVVAPDYIQVVANIPAERKPAAILVAKMASLSANTTADAESVLSDKTAVNFMNKYGDLVVAGVMAHRPELNRMLGSPYKEGQKDHSDIAKKVTGRLPLLPIVQQESIYEAIIQEYNDYIAHLDSIGRNDLEAKNFDLDAKTIETVEVTPKTGESPFQGKVVAEKIDMKRIGRPMTGDEVQAEASKNENNGNDDAAKALEEFDKFEEKELERLRKRISEAKNSSKRNVAEETLSNRMNQLRDNRRSFESMNEMFMVGDTVSVDLGSDTTPMLGVVIDKMKQGDPANPLALSAWKVKIAVADGIRIVPLPFSRFRSVSNPDSSVKATPELTTLEEAKSVFDEALSVSREERWMITGNLFSGFATFSGSNGQIMNFSREDGTLEQGILMPGTFDPQSTIDSTPVSFESKEQAFEYMDSVGNSQVKLRSTGNLRIQHTADGNYRVATDKAVGKAGKFFRDDGALLDIVGSFGSVSDRMTTDVLSKEQIEKVFDLFSTRGNTWFADDSIDVARGIVYKESLVDGEVRTSRTTDGAKKLPKEKQADVKTELKEQIGWKALSALEAKGLLKVITPDQVEGVLRKAKARFKLAWHGSLSKYNKISTDKVGSSQGDSVYGWGIYLSDKKEVAEFYKKGESGSLYQVDMKPREEEYLLWDKPLSEQSDFVKEKISAKHISEWSSDDSTTGEDYYRFHEREEMDSREASMFLLNEGVRGIKYLDKASLEKGERVYNYVIFDENDVTIEARYSKAGIIEAFTMPNGTMYLVQGGIKKGESYQTLLHEAGHSHLPEAFKGKEWNSLVKGMNRHKGKDTKTGKAIDAAYKRVPESTPDHLKEEEAMMYFITSQANVKLPFYQRVLGFMRRALVKIGFPPRILAPNDLVEIAKGYLAKQGKAKTSGKGNEKDIRFSRTPLVPKKYRDAVKKITDTKAFKKWFGSSKITSNGEPHILYHGSSHPKFLQDKDYPWVFDTTKSVNKASSPLAGLGIFLGNDVIADAHSMGTPGTTHPFFVKVENPFVTTADELEKQISDVDSAKAFKKRKELQGHDGIILKDRGHVIAFNANQLKSATDNTGDFSTTNDDVRFSVSDDLIGNDIANFAAEEMDGKLGNLIFKKASKQDMTSIEKALSTPEYSYRKDPAATRVLKAQLDRTDLKNKYTDDILGSYHYNDKGMLVEQGEFVTFFSKLLKENEKSYNTVKDYLTKTDQDNVGFKIKKKDGVWGVYDREGKFVKGTEQRGRQAEQKATGKSMQLESEFLRGNGFTEDEVKAVRLLRAVTNRAFDLIVADLRRIEQQAKDSGHPPPMIGKMTLREAMAEMGQLRGTFMPRIRPDGGYVIIAKKEGENPERHHFDMPPLDSSKGWGPVKLLKKMTNHVSPAGKKVKELREKGYDVTVERDESISEDVFDATGLVTSMGSVIDSVTQAEDESIMSSDAAMNLSTEVSNILTNKVANIFKSRGYLSTKMARNKDEVWEGYETDPLKAVVQYSKNIAAGMAKRETAQKMIMAFMGRDYSFEAYKKDVADGKFPGVADAKFIDWKKIVEERRVHPGKQKVLYGEVRSFMVEMLRNDQLADRAMGTLKGLAAIKFLGFRISSAAVNLTNMVQAVPATISANTADGIGKSLRRVKRAAVSYGTYRRNPSKLSVKDRNIYQGIVSRHWDQAQYNMELASAVRTKFGNRWAKFVDLSMLMFGAAEKVNRATTIFAAFKAVESQAKKENKNMSFDEIMNKAHAISNDAHGVYGKETIPTWARGSANPLKLAYTFQKFSHNYMLNLIEIGFKKKDLRSAAYMLLSPAIMGGAGATLATPVIATIAGALGLGGDDPEEEFYTWAEKTFGKGGATLARQGIPGLAGVSFKGSLQVNNPVPMRLSELFGAPQSVITDVIKSGKHLASGEYYKSFESFMPTAFGNMSKAVRESREGVTTGSYGQVFYGSKPLKANGWDAFVRFISFNPARLSGIREKQWNEKQVKAKYQKRRSKINHKFSKAYIQYHGKVPGWKLAELLKEVNYYNDLVRGSGRTDIGPITGRSLRSVIKRTVVAPKNERLRKLDYK